MSYTIITHDGKAHMDEILGSALLALHLGETPEHIERMNAQEAADLISTGTIPENTYFIDCGLVLDSGKGLFDHHQDRELDSSVLLIFNEYFPHLKDTELHKYFKLVSKVDTKGAMSLDDFHLVSESRDYFTFGQGILLNTFQNDPLLVLKIFIEGLDDKISFEKLKQKADIWLNESGNIEILVVDHIKVIKYLEKAPSELASPIRSVISKIVDDNDITAILSFDDKQPDVLTLFRTNYGHNNIDFSKSNPSETIFKHPGGFLMKFIPSDSTEWIKLIRESL
ncbi:MAG: MYG1 family protein [Spirochaetia bacterium]|jgi:hypothetical protein|nr:MYG1 family protein [Spirochaetia bacterium]